jgi:hypothetical protein
MVVWSRVFSSVSMVTSAVLIIRLFFKALPLSFREREAEERFLGFARNDSEEQPRDPRAAKKKHIPRAQTALGMTTGRAHTSRRKHAATKSRYARGAARQRVPRDDCNGPFFLLESAPFDLAEGRAKPPTRLSYIERSWKSLGRAEFFLKGL